jgi:membrane protein insertase Oxa1/YidC/SpoIIIJ
LLLYFCLQILTVMPASIFSWLLIVHSLLRWLVLISMLYAIYRAYKGLRSNALFTKADNTARVLCLTFTHIQVVIGVVLYFSSPIVSYFHHNFSNAAAHHGDSGFFGMNHMFLMIVAAIILTIGSAKTKRRTNDRKKFKTMLVWFCITLFIIFIAIPWPFSPFTARPYFRHF